MYDPGPPFSGRSRALEADNAAGRQDTAKKLKAFIAFVEAQRGKALTDEQASQLVELASEILAELQSSDTG